MTGRRKRNYSETEKLGAIVVAVRDGVHAASRRLCVPERTLYEWLEAAGGIAEIRNLANARAELSLSEAEKALCEEVARRMRLGKMSDDELMRSFRALLEVHGRQPANSTGAAAGAQAAVNVWKISATE